MHVIKQNVVRGGNNPEAILIPKVVPIFRMIAVEKTHSAAYLAAMKITVLRS